MIIPWSYFFFLILVFLFVFQYKVHHKIDHWYQCNAIAANELNSKVRNSVKAKIIAMSHSITVCSLLILYSIPLEINMLTSSVRRANESTTADAEDGEGKREPKSKPKHNC